MPHGVVFQLGYDMLTFLGNTPKREHAMGLVTTSLAVFGFASDALAVGQAITAMLRKQNCSAVELFRKCFVLAVTRHRTRLLHFCCEEASSIMADENLLTKVLTGLDERKDLVLPTVAADSLVPLFADCVIIPGHQLVKQDLLRELTPLVQDSFSDFFHQLPSTPEAFREVELEHCINSAVEAGAQAAAHQLQQATLARIESVLLRIEAKQKELDERDVYFDPTVMQQESSRPEHHNPFRIVKAEDFDHDYTRLALLFREPSDYEHIKGSGNLIIAGGRGCGKSMILRSLSLQAGIAIAQLRLKQPSAMPVPQRLTYAEAGLKHLGVYIKLARGYFYEWTPDCKLTRDAATMLFQHVFNMLLLKSLLETLIRARDIGILHIDAIHERFIVQRIKEIGSFSFSGEAFDSLMTHLRFQENQVAQYLGQLRLGSLPQGYQGQLTYIHNFIDQCCADILNTIPELNGSRVFFLLDEYENLATFQQSVVNTLAKLRPLSLTLKIATRPLGVKSREDLQKEPIQIPRDYHQVELDYDIEEKPYRELLLDIAQKRLRAEGYAETDVRKLLESAPPFDPASQSEVEAAVRKLALAKGVDVSTESQWKEQMHQWGHAMVYRLTAAAKRQPRTYAGFNDIADLSSGIISTFLELCKMAFYRAEGEGVKAKAGETISWHIQNRAIYDTSRAYLDWIPRNIEQTGPTISRFVLDVSDIIREKLLRHGSEPEAGRLTVKDPEALDAQEYKQLRRVLDDGVRWSVLHQCGQGGSYFPKHKTDVRTSEFYLNRVLCPILRISARPRWTTTFRAADLAKLLETGSRAKTKSSLITRCRVSSSSQLFDSQGSANE